ncbi:hypothetical protein A6A25_31105 [Saccharothrix sp. CB00851]|nr:hypothetical protein A6A25_31105 [Saccharothrix sp. CB00851]
MWLVLAPSILEYPESGAAVADGAVGAVVVVVAIIGAVVPRGVPWFDVITAVLGAWTSVSPFVLDHAASRSVIVNEVVVGVVLTVSSLGTCRSRWSGRGRAGRAAVRSRR